MYCTTPRDAQSQPPGATPWVQGSAQLSYRVVAKPRLSGDGDMVEDNATMEQFKRSRLWDPETEEPLDVDDDGGMAY